LIEHLRIEQIAIVDEAELEFGPGLNVLTGETGAGKSVVLGALSLLVGGRPGPGTLRDGANEGAVEAIFDTAALPDLEADLRGRGLVGEAADEGVGASDESAEAHEIVVRRTLSASARSRSRVGGQLVPLGALAELFAGRVEISSQHSSQALLRPESHGRFLDAAGGLLVLREEVRSLYESIVAIDRELAALREQAEERARQQDFLAFQLNEFDDVGLEPGELEEIDREHAKLAHHERLRSLGGGALVALRGDEGGSGAGAAADAVAAAAAAVDDMATLDGELEALAGRLRAADNELRDISSDLDRYVDRIDGDPARLERLEERMAAIERLRRKFGQSEEEIFAYRDRLGAELDSSEAADSRIDALTDDRRRLAAALSDTAAQLSSGRAKAGRKLARAVQKSLRDLAMPEARFSVDLSPLANQSRMPDGVTAGPAGAEAPEFLFSANKGETPRSLQKVASGGELSRVFLAVKNALRGAAAHMVLVFDEVDAGIGGRAAERVGRVLAELAQGHQVLCITHLPQIAAFADVHFKVEKAEKKGRASVRIERIEGAAREEEIARMASGENITKAARQHARDLLQLKFDS
jgi:DNA repair protein RecN (Recombination protein N)